MGDGKDQSYALAQLAREQLDTLLLPLGGLTKAQTREHAQRLGLAVHDKTESQDICFVEGGDYREVLERLAPDARVPGHVVDGAGTPLGTHAGVLDFTVGQRRGVPANASGEPRYVTRIDAATNTIVVGREDELLAAGLMADAFNLIRPEAFASGEADVLAMIRYRSRQVRARARIGAGDTLELEFAEPQRAVAPGQLVALYALDGEEVLGAATIVEAL